MSDDRDKSKVKTHFMVESISDVIVGLNRGNKVTRNQPCALMNQLVKSMLAIGSRLTPDNGACGIVNIRSRSGDIPKQNIDLINE